MPTYEYACKQCGDHLEVVQKFTDDALTVCPSCDGPLRKVFGNIGISFKGSGFYKNDSRSSGEVAKKKEPSGESGSGESGSSGGSDSPATPKADAPAAKADASKGDKPKSDKGSSTAAAS